MSNTSKYPPEMETYVRRMYRSYTCRQMIPLIRKRFGFEMTLSSMKSYITNRKITCGGLQGKRVPQIFTPEIKKYIMENYKGTGYQKMADKLNKRFGTSFTASQIKSFYGRNRLDSGLTGRFEKGHVPYSKGKTWDEYMSARGAAKSRETTFRKGHVPEGTAPVGTVRLRKNQNMYFEKTAMPNKWRPKHLVEWEKNNGPVPKGCVISFADGDTSNWHIDNLMPVKKGVHAYKNRNGLHGKDRPTNEAANAVAELKILIGRKRRE